MPELIRREQKSHLGPLLIHCGSLKKTKMSDYVEWWWFVAPIIIVIKLIVVGIWLFIRWKRSKERERERERFQREQQAQRHQQQDSGGYPYQQQHAYAPPPYWNTGGNQAPAASNAGWTQPQDGYLTKPSAGEGKY